MALDGILLAETVKRALESVEQDQTALLCRLILIYTLRNLVYGRERQDRC